jgi:hypothetical protein
LRQKTRTREQPPLPKLLVGEWVLTVFCVFLCLFSLALAGVLGMGDFSGVGIAGVLLMAFSSWEVAVCLRWGARRAAAWCLGVVTVLWWVLTVGVGYAVLTMLSRVYLLAVVAFVLLGVLFTLLTRWLWNLQEESSS